MSIDNVETDKVQVRARTTARVPLPATIPVRVLILEDQPGDAELMIRQLSRSGFEPSWERVDTEAEYIAQLASLPDVILADFRMPQLNAVRALELLQESGLAIPFIVVSGAIGEDVAVAMMRSGASDYLLKDRMARLGPAVRQAIEKRALEDQTRRSAEELRASEIRFQSFMNNSPTLARLKESDGRLLYMNNTCEQLYGLSISDCEGKTDHDLWPKDVADRLRANDLAVLESGVPSRVVEEVTLPSGRTLDLLTFRFPVFDASGHRMLGEVSAEISEQIRTQRALSEALAVKEVLFRELHHRVKNNLNVVSSLLTLQAQTLKDSPAGLALGDAQRRIGCMALVHDRLNNRDNADEIDFREYTSSLSQDLLRIYERGDRAISLRLELGPASLALNQAVPCGLILNELITNSLKYAFPNGRSGEIVVSLSLSDDVVRVAVEDNGVGLPAGFDWMERIPFAGTTDRHDFEPSAQCDCGVWKRPRGFVRLVISHILGIWAPDKKSPLARTWDRRYSQLPAQGNSSVLLFSTFQGFGQRTNKEPRYLW